MGNTYLIHHGIKGQKWGIRRTAAQLGHKVSGAIKKRKEARSTAKAAKKAQKVELTVEQKKEQVLKSRSAAELYKNAPLFSTNELQSAYNRLSLERNIKNLIPEEVSRGEAFVRKVRKLSDIFQSSSNAVNNASNMYNNVAKVFNAMSDSDNQLPIIGQQKDKPKAEKKTVQDKMEYTDEKGNKHTVTSTWKEDVKNPAPKQETKNNSKKEPEVETVSGTVEPTSWEYDPTRRKRMAPGLPG